jgi:hypothetical protein
MPFFAIVGFAASSLVVPQQAVAWAVSPQVTAQVQEVQEVQQQAPSQTQAPQPTEIAPPTAPGAQVSAPTITVPLGTQISLLLTSPITNKNAHAGNLVRAATAFPVTVDSQFAIPVGTFVEGVIDKVKGRDANGRPGIQMHFTRMIFSNGYTVPLGSNSGEIAENRVTRPEQAGPAEGATVAARAEEQASFQLASFRPASFGGAGSDAATFRIASFTSVGYAVAAQQAPPPPPLPPLPHVGPPTGVIVGLVAAGVAAAVIAIVALHRGATYFYYSPGWQFEMTLERPLVLDADAVANAASLQ